MKREQLAEFGTPVVSYSDAVTLKYTQYGGEGYLRGGDKELLVRGNSFIS